MEFEEFVEATCTILEEDGFASFLPTLWVGDEILVVEGIPESVSDTDALNDMGPEQGLGELGSFFAVRTEPELVVAGECRADGWHFVQICPSSQGLAVTRAARPAWFRVEA